MRVKFWNGLAGSTTVKDRLASLIFTTVHNSELLKAQEIMRVTRTAPTEQTFSRGNY